MLFNSIEFILFFPVVVCVYYLLPHRVRYLWLLAASYFFYMNWNARYALLLLFSTAATYLGALLIGRRRERNGGQDRGSAAILAAVIIVNLLILFLFKYYTFAADLLTGFLGLFHLHFEMPALHLLLPVGISFYTFQALGYIIDVYRGDVEIEKNFFMYALFVSFFPQLVAGPIERSGNLLWQLKKRKKFDYPSFRDGILLMMWGYFLKIVIADRLAIFVDTVYADPAAWPGAYLVVATVFFSFQIYCDFAGYSTIAMGAAQIMGIRLMDNFNAPYLSLSVGEFWRNWHISLTSWFRDYLYIPLGGSHKGKVRKAVNKMIVFLTSGLWHGANLTYVIWGGLNGFYQIIEDLFAGKKKKRTKQDNGEDEPKDLRQIGIRGLKYLLVYCLVTFSWIFFRASGLRSALGIIRSVFTDLNPWVLLDGSLLNCGLDMYDFFVLSVSLVILLAADICKRKEIRLRDIVTGQYFWVRWIVIPLMVAGILLFGVWGPSFAAANFIYFQF